jgi:hypothetical protein
LSWPFAPAGLPLFYLWLAWAWWFEIRAQVLVVTETVPAMSADTMATFALSARALATLSEAGLYALWWRSRGRRLPYWRLLCWVAALSTTDLFGFSLRRAVEDAPDALRMLAAVLAGPGALETSATGTGAMVGFGSLGVLTGVRVAMTAWAQARGMGAPLAGPLVLTTMAWLLTRLIGWWSVDLMRGLSPAP